MFITRAYKLTRLLAMPVTVAHWQVNAKQASGASSSLVHPATSAATEKAPVATADGVPVVTVSWVPNLSMMSFVEMVI